MHKLVSFVSLGCAKNRVNTEQMMFRLRQAGYLVSGDTDGADVVVLNTCGFVGSAKTEAIDNILELAELKKSGTVGKLVVAGCLSQRYKDDILTELPEIDAVVGTGSFDDIVSVIDALWDSTDKLVRFGDISAPVSETGRILSTSSVWAYLKISEGCDNRCAYCCIPDIRGSFRSRPMENILKEAIELVNNGVRELILVAQDTTMYGLDLYGERRLTELLRELGAIKKLHWIRLLYLYPNDIDNQLIDEISKNGKIVKYLDIPIQHISDNILSKMNRRGTGDEIRSLLKTLRERIDGLVLRTSVITGLPGEGEEEFTLLYEFLKEFKFERTGVFAYSPEEGTAAALMERPPEDVAQQRASLIYQLGTDIMESFDKSRVGSVITVLTDAYGEADYVTARSYAETPEVDGEIRVVGNNVKFNTFVDINIIGVENGELVGEQV